MRAHKRQRARARAGATAPPGPALLPSLPGSPGPPCTARPASQFARSLPPPARSGRHSAPRPRAVVPELPAARRGGGGSRRGPPKRRRRRQDGGLPAVAVRAVRVLPRLRADERRGRAAAQVQGDRQMPVPGEDLREAAGEDPAAGRGRERQVYFPEADADHPRAGFRPARARGVPPHHLQQRDQRCRAGIGAGGLRAGAAAGASGGPRGAGHRPRSLCPRRRTGAGGRAGRQGARPER